MSKIDSLSRPVATVAYVVLFLVTAAPTQTPSDSVVSMAKEPVAKAAAAPTLGISEYEGLIANDPQNMIAVNNLGTIYFETGRLVDAIELIKRAADARPDIWNFQLNASIVYTKQGEFANALHYAQLAFKLAPTELHVREQLCNTHLSVGNAEDALNGFEELAHDSKDPADSLGYGEALLLSGDLAKAGTVLRTVITALPMCAEAHNALGTVLYNQKHYSDAAASFRQAISLDPDTSKYRFNLAVAEMAVRNREGAFSQYNLLKRSDPALADKLYRMMFADNLVYVDH